MICHRKSLSRTSKATFPNETYRAPATVVFGQRRTDTSADCRRHSDERKKKGRQSADTASCMAEKKSLTQTLPSRFFSRQRSEDRRTVAGARADTKQKKPSPRKKQKNGIDFFRNMRSHFVCTFFEIFLRYHGQPILPVFSHILLSEVHKGWLAPQRDRVGRFLLRARMVRGRAKCACPVPCLVLET